MSTPTTNDTQNFEVNNNNTYNHSAETIATRFQRIGLSPAAEGPNNMPHMTPSSSALRSVVFPLSTEIPPNAVPNPEIGLVSLLEDLKMLVNKLNTLESSHRIFGTGEDMVFRPIKNVVRMIEFMENGLTWMRLALFEYETAASAPHPDPNVVEDRLNKLRVVMDDFFQQMNENDEVVRREFHRIIELEQTENHDLHHLLVRQINLDD